MQLGDGVTTLETISSLPAVFSALNSVWIDVPEGSAASGASPLSSVAGKLILGVTVLPGLRV